MATKKTQPTKKYSKKTTEQAGSARVLKQPGYSRFRYSKRIKHPSPKLPGAFGLFVKTLKLLKQNWKIFGSIILIFVLLSILFVRGTAGGMGVTTLKSSFDSAVDSRDFYGQLTSGVAVFGVLIGRAGIQNNQAAGLYQSIITLLASLALIWTLRQVHGKKKAPVVSVKRAFYKSTHPLVPFILLILLIAFQLIPAFVSGAVYNTVVSSGLAVTFWEKFAWAGGFFGLTVLSLYWITATLLSLYIVTLPDMTPMRAHRTARELVKLRRWTVMRKMLILPVFILVVASVVMIPAIIFVAFLAEWVFMVLAIIGLAIFHSYMYVLYRELI